MAKASNDSINNLFLNLDFFNLDTPTARKLATPILDACKVPHGDMSFPSDTVHSGRFFVSQWQRSAVGAVVVIFGIDEEEDL